MANELFIPKARSANELASEAVASGSLIVTPDTGELYADLSGGRVKISDVIELATDAARTALLAPLSKFYYVKATGKLWRWDGAKWVNLSPDCLPLNGVAKAAEKLQTARSISLAGIVRGSASFDGSANKTITVSPVSNELMALYKPYTYNTTGVLTVLDAAAMGLWRNMSAFLDPENVTYETSADGGETWTTDTALTTEAMTRGIFSGVYGNGSIQMFKSPAPMTTSKQMRMTIDVGTGRYGTVSRLYLYVNIANHVVVLDVERATKGSPDVFVPVVSDKKIAGWSGPNIISLGGTITWGGGSTSNTQRFRLTFRCTSVNDAYPNSIPIIYDIRLYGDTVWTPNNNLQNSGHLYKWDGNQNVTFPANLTADSIDATKLTGVMPEAVHPTTAGNNHIPAGGATNNILAYAGAGTAGWTDFKRTMMVHAGSVNANSDFNDCTTPGEYTVSANPVVNGPISVCYGLLLVLTRINTDGAGNNSNYVFQFLFMADARVWFRSRISNGTWTSWAVLITSAMLATTTANGLMSAADKAKLDGLSGGSADACSLFGTGITPPELLGKYVKQADGSYVNTASTGNGGYVIRLATGGTWEIYSTDFSMTLWTTSASVEHPWQVDAWTADSSSFATGTPQIIQL
ncbi:MAG: hypothetical protein PHI85_09095 [Victivallaceae bacterium]|nr:hypothetical protein [Victivallaceae bacterium]